MMAFWILRDSVPLNELWQNIQGKISSQPYVGQTLQKTEERHNDDDDDNDINIRDEIIEAPNDNDYH